MLRRLGTIFPALLLLFAMQLPIHAAEIPLQLNYVVTTDWGSGYNVDVTIKNNSQSPVESWKATFDLPEGQTLSSLWNGVWLAERQHISVENTSWNGALAPGALTTFGFGVVSDGANPAGIRNLSGSGFNAAAPPPESTAFYLEASYHIEGAWQEGFFAVIYLNNPTGNQMDSWVVECDLPAEVNAITNLWGGNYVFEQGHVRITNPDCPDETHIPASETLKIGFSAATAAPTTPALYNLAAAANAASVPVFAEPPEEPLLDPIASSGGNYTLRWHAVPNADRYVLEEASSADFSNARILYQGNATQYQVQDQQPGTYYYRVQASNQFGAGPYSVPQAITIAASALPAPQLYPSEYDPAARLIRLHWSAVAGADGYRVEEARNSGFNPFSVVYEGDSLSLELAEGAAGTYYYRVKAFDDTKTSAPSAVETLVIPSEAADKEFKVIGYFPNWAMYRTNPFYPKDINPDQVTHINYAFTRVDTSGNIHLFDPWADVEYRTDWTTQKPFWGHFGQFAEIKAQHPELKTLVSVGGWTLSDTFSQLAEKQETRENFARECVRFCKQYGFDGVDIDWEYPNYAEHNGRPIDTVNFTLLLEECQRALKAENPPLLLTIAAPAGPWHYANIEVDKIHQHLDWVNLMCYDFHGPWGGSSDNVTNHHSGLYATQEGDPRLNMDEAVRYYLDAGVPKEKLVVGVPFYGRSYSGVNSAADGLFSAYTGSGSGTTEEEGMLFFYDIKRNYLQSHQLFWDEQAKVPYLYSPSKREFVTFENEDSLRLKCRRIKELGLSGVMFWEISLDTRPAWDLLNVINQELK